MIKTITKVGNSHGIIFDSALLQLARLKPGDTVNLEVHEGGTITITPAAGEFISPQEGADAARRLISVNDELFKRPS